MGIRSGLMVQGMKVTGNLIRQTDTESWFMPMETYTKENGLMIKLTVKELTLMLMALITMGTG